MCEQTALSVRRFDSAPQRGHPPGSTASFINQGSCTTRYSRLSNLAACLKYNYVGLGVERRDSDVGVQSGVYRKGVGGLFSFLPYCRWCGEGVRERGRQRRGGDLSDTSSPSFRTESQYSKLPSADKKKKWAWLPYEQNRIVRKRWHIDCLVCASRRLGFRGVLLYIYVEEVQQCTAQTWGGMRNWNAMLDCSPFLKPTSLVQPGRPP